MSLWETENYSFQPSKLPQVSEITTGTSGNAKGLRVYGQSCGSNLTLIKLRKCFLPVWQTSYNLFPFLRHQVGPIRILQLRLEAPKVGLA